MYLIELFKYLGFKFVFAGFPNYLINIFTYRSHLITVNATAGLFILSSSYGIRIPIRNNNT